MISSIAFDPDALADLSARFDYLHPRAGERIARDHLGRIFAYCLALETFPERDRRRDDLRPGLRLVGYRRQATIAFTIDADRVLILRILFAGQDVERWAKPAEG